MQKLAGSKRPRKANASPEEQVALARARTAASFTATPAAGKKKAGGQPRRMHVIVVDEIDGLVASRGGGGGGGGLLETLLCLPHAAATSHVVVVGISNVIDLPGRLAPALRAPSPRAPQTLVFAPYGVDDIVRIVRARLEDPATAAAAVAAAGAGGPAAPTQTIFEPVALSFLAKRVGSHLGDVRRALHLARKAVLAACADWCSCDAAERVAAAVTGGVGGGDGGDVEGDGSDAASSAAAGARLSELGLLFAGAAEEGAAAATQASPSDSRSPPRRAAEKATAGSSPVLRPVPRGGAAREPPLTPSPRRGAPVSPSAEPRALSQCSCTLHGGRWREDPLPRLAGGDVHPGGGSGAAARVAVSLAAMKAILCAAFDSPFVGLLRALPLHVSAGAARARAPRARCLPPPSLPCIRQGQVMICAARALAERAGQQAAAAAAARVEAANPLVFATHEGATGVRVAAAAAGAGVRGGASGRAKDVNSAFNAAARAAAVPVARLRDVFTGLCRRKLAAPIAVSEFNDLLDRVVVRWGGGGR